MNTKNELISHLRFFLINKLFLLRKEVYYIKWSMEYIKHLELQLEEENNEKYKNQFINDCDLIIDFIEMLDGKIKNILDQISDISLESKSIIELIILFDCINERINNSILKKFDYVYKSYENLILSYNHLYVPTTSVSKLAKTPNLMLFFNKKLNEISKIFSKLTKKTDSNYKKIFSTWNFIDTDHVADFYETNDKVYLEFSFWLYEMPIFHCIALHEIYHKYYFDDDEVIFTENDLNFFKENLPHVIKTDTGLLIEDFSENFIISLYQEILADLHTYIFAKENYIYTLFINGFLVEFNHSFLGIMNPNKNISPDDKCCFKRMEKMSIYNFDFKKKQILYFVRLFFLIKYVEKYDKDIYDSEIVQFIIDILQIVFPINLRNNYKNFDNFDNLLKDFVSYKMYKKNKYIIEILTEIYYRLFLNKNIFHTIFKRQNEIRNKRYCSNFLNRFDFFKNKFYQMNLESNDKDYIQKKYIQFNHDLQEEFRKVNIKELKINIDTENIKERIYFLTNIKIARNNQIDAFILFKNEILKKGNFFYSFGPFDFVRLAPKTNNFIDELDSELENKNFFIDNHSLFLIKKYNKENRQQNNEIFNLMLSIDIKNAFSNYEDETTEESTEQKTNEQKIVEQINDFFEQEEILQKHQGWLFFSMGNENLVLIIYHINKDEVEEIIDRFHNLNNISHISSTILLNEKFFLPENEDLILEDLVILVKLKPMTLGEKYTKLYEKIYNEKWRGIYSQDTDDCEKDNIRLFKKLGVYDAKIIIRNISIKYLEILIKEISDLTIDIQIEKEIKAIKME